MKSPGLLKPIALVAAFLVAQTQIARIQAAQSGNVTGWGEQLVYPLNGHDATFTKVAAGQFHNLVLKSDGTVIAWGLNVFGASTVPPGLSEVMAIAAGYGHSLALKQDGTVLGWGQTTVPADLTIATAIAAGQAHSLALKQDGTVVAWGDDTYGQCGGAAGLSGVKDIAAGAVHSLALMQDGTVIAWGNNDAGQSSVPAGLSGVKAIAAGRYHSLALKEDGSVIAWGGLAGVPAEVSSGVVAIASGGAHNLALKQGGTVVAWGSDEFGESTVPAGLTGVTDIAAGEGHSLALRQDGSVIAWGSNSYGQSTSPNGLSGIIAVSAGSEHNLLLKQDGTVVAWGVDVLGPSFGRSTVPPGLSGVTAVAAGGLHSLALKQDGTVIQWGDTFENVPTGLNGVAAIAAGDVHSLALRNDGTVVAWGDDSWGQKAVPAGLTGVIAIAAGRDHSLALTQNGKVEAWGANLSGQCDVPVDALSGVMAIAAGDEHSLALKQDGTVIAWGWDAAVGQYRVPFGLSGVAAIAAGTYLSLALRQNGTIVEWGGGLEDYSHEVPAGMRGVFAIAAGRGLQNLALFSDFSRPPVAGQFSTTCLQNSSTTILVTDLLAVCSDPDGDALSITGVSAASANGGTAQLANSIITYTPPPGFVGTDTFTYRVKDLTGLSSHGTVTIAVEGSPPVPGPFSTVCAENLGFSVPTANLVAVSSDPDGDALGITGVSATSARGGTVQLVNSLITYSPPLGFVGTDTFSYTITDASGLSAQGTVTVIVEGQPPVGGPYIARGLRNSSTRFFAADLLAVCSDPNGDTLNITGVSATSAQGGTVQLANSIVTYTAPVAFTGTDTFSYTVTDSTGLSSQGTVSVSVIDPGPAGIVVAWGAAFEDPSDVPGFFRDPDNPQAVAIAAGPDHTMVLELNGRVEGFGMTFLTDPGVDGSMIAIAAGSRYGLALRLDGTVLVRGDNLFVTTAVPADLVGVTAIAAGASHGLALTQDGMVRAWGFNQFGQASVPPEALSGVVAIAAGYEHSLAVKDNGTVVAWGLNDFGQSTVPPGLTAVIAVSAGRYHSLALKQDGTVVAWGIVGGEQSTVPAGLTGVIAIAAGDQHNLALKRDGTVVAWGENGAGQCTVPADLTGVIAIAAGIGNSFALRTPPPTDTAPPILSGVPGNMTVEATAPDPDSGAVVTWIAPTALDLVDGPVPVNCTIASGSFFGLGLSTVTCTATDSHGNTATANFTVNVVDTTPPVISGVPADQTVEATSSAGAIVTWPDLAANDLVRGLVPVICSPASGSTFALGETTVTCTANDGYFLGPNSASASFKVTVVDTSAPIIVSCAPPQNAIPDASGLAVVPDFTALTTATDNHTPSASFNKTQVPPAGTTVGLGTTTITITVEDSARNRASCSTAFKVSVNTAPTITVIANQTINEDTATTALAFTIGDAQTPLSGLTVKGSSSNPLLIPDSKIVFDGNGANRTVTVTPAPNENGSATITLTVSDGILSTSRSFVLTVNPLNDPPTITSIPDQVLNPDASTGLRFTIDDIDTGMSKLILGKGSSNPALIPIGNIVFGGNGANRIVTIRPAANQSGTATITVSVNDGQVSTPTSFTVTVRSSFIGTKTFSETTAINVPSVGTATPYPSTVNVTGMGGIISFATLTLNYLSHASPNNLDMLLVGPGGQKVMVFSGAGDGKDVNGIAVTLSDSAATLLPQNTKIQSGVYRPADYEHVNAMPAPAPAGPYSSRLSVFNGLSGAAVNGAWALYVIDDTALNTGRIAGGWTLTLTTVDGP